MPQHFLRYDYDYFSPHYPQRNRILDPCRLSSVAFRSIINQETDIVNFYIVMQLSEKYVMKEDKFLIKDVIFENFNS